MSSAPKSQWSWELTAQLRKSEVQFLIINYKLRTALLRWEEEHWVLPGLFTKCSESYVKLLLEEVREALNIGACLWPARVVWSIQQECKVKGRSGKPAKGEYYKSVMLLECCEGEPVVHRYRWESLAEKQVYHLFHHAASRIKEEIVTALTGAYIEKRLPWERPGWLQRTITLLENKVESKVVQPITILRSSPRGAVFRACTAKGRFYVKGSNWATNDSSFSAAMARIIPKYCPMPLFVEKENRTMIMQDYGESVTMISWKGVNSVVKEECCDVLGSVQRATIGKTDDLIEAGFIDARLQQLLERFEEVVNHPELLMAHKTCENDPQIFKNLLEKLVQFRKNTENVKKGMQNVLKEIAKFDIPVTVLHNDIISNNFCRDTETGKLKLIDWEFGCVGHPFMDRSCSPKSQTYCDHWSDYCTQAEIAEMHSKFTPYSHVIYLIQRLNVMADVEASVKAKFFSNIAYGLGCLLSALKYCDSDER